MKLPGFASLLSTVIGTALVWFDTERISYAIQPGHMVLTDDPKWKSWRYNKSKLGFALLFIGIARWNLSPLFQLSNVTDTRPATPSGCG
jgi:hypothetical protein